MKKLIKLLTIMLLISFPFGVIFRVKLFSNVQIVPQDILVIAIGLFMICDSLRKKKLHFESFLKTQFLFVIFGIVSLFINFFIHRDINLAFSILYVLRYIAYVSLINVGHYFKNSKIIGKLILISGSIFIFFGFFQYYFYNSLSQLKYLGWDIHLYRLFSTFLDPNFAGVFYTFFIFLLIPKVTHLRLKESYLYLLLFFFNFLAIMMTYSRTALITLFSSLFIYSVIKHKFKMFLLVVTFLIVSLFIFSDVGVEGLNPFRTASSSERIVSLANALTISKNNPLIGVGFNGYRDAQLRYGFRNSIGASTSNADAGTDNSLLFVFATTGIIGFLIYLGSYATLLKVVYFEKKEINILIFCALTGLLFGSFFLNVLFYTPILSFVLITVSCRRNIDQGL